MDEPTERQLEYAHSLGIERPESHTRTSLSAAIDAKLAGPLAHPAHLELARRIGLDVASDTPKRKLFELIWRHFDQAESPAALCGWFAYRVHRHRLKRLASTSTEPFPFPSDTWSAIGEDLAKDPRIVRSLRREAQAMEGPFRWFGDYTLPNGQVITGNSIGTVAYKAAADAIKRHVEPSIAVKTTTPHVRHEPSRKPPSLATWIGVALLMWLIFAIAK